jgi:hypothetical protein
MTPWAWFAGVQKMAFADPTPNQPTAFRFRDAVKNLQLAPRSGAGRLFDKARRVLPNTVRRKRTGEAPQQPTGGSAVKNPPAGPGGYDLSPMMMPVMMVMMPACAGSGRNGNRESENSCESNGKLLHLDLEG